jgi:uncharacterized membrane protein
MEALITIVVILFLVGPILGVIALVRTSSLQTKIDELKRKLDAIDFARPVAAAASADAPSATAPLAQETTFEPEVASGPWVDEPPSKPDPVDLPAPPPAATRNIEQALASRWLVWLGGIAIALGGLLLIKYAHDNGLVPPIVRVIVGLATGAALAIAGEWLRLKRGDTVQDYVPAALSAAGLIIAFGVSYAAYALYNIFAPAVVFPLLAAISLCALWLATRQGQLIAALGLIGATFTPALVESNDPSTSGFFAYLLVILVASLWLLRRLNWWWLGYAAVAVTAGWALLWINGVSLNPTLPIGLFGLAIGAAATLVPRGRDILNAEMGTLIDSKTVTQPLGVAIAGIVAGGIVLSALVVQSGHAPLPLLMFAVGMAAIVAFGWFREGFVAAPLLAAAATLLVLLTWRDVGFHTLAFDERGFWTTVPGLIEPPRFRSAMLAALAGFTAIGVLGAWVERDRRTWAALASGSAFLFLMAAWGRADFTLSNMTWAALGIVLAAILGAAAFRLMNKRDDDTATTSFEFLVVGVTLTSIFALDRLLDGVWLTIAIAALAAAIAYLARMTSLSNIGAIASVVASFAAARLFLGREFWGEPRDLPLGGYWVLYGYGVPALLYWQASRWLTADTLTRWRVAFEGLSIGLLVAMVSLVLRVWIGGGITRDEMGLLELSAHACAWLGAAYGLAYRQQLYSSFVSMWGARVLLAASTLALIAVLTFKNPVFSYEAVAGGQYINALWLAYLVPVALLALMARKLEGLGWAQFRSGIGVLALVLLMTFITLLVKRQFQDATLDFEFLSQPESYAVSLAWLVSGIGIFIAGLKMDRQTVRYGGLAILVLTVLKVFGYDLFSLGGLWRIASMIGLGLCLVGVGWLYTRFIVRKAKPIEATPNPETVV